MSTNSINNNHTVNSFVSGWTYIYICSSPLKIYISHKNKDKLLLGFILKIKEKLFTKKLTLL